MIRKGNGRDKVSAAFVLLVISPSQHLCIWSQIRIEANCCASDKDWGELLCLVYEFCAQRTHIFLKDHINKPKVRRQHGFARAIPMLISVATATHIINHGMHYEDSKGAVSRSAIPLDQVGWTLMRVPKSKGDVTWSYLDINPIKGSGKNTRLFTIKEQV